MSSPSPSAGAPLPSGVALVTGAAHRLGREIALGLARAGWDIAVHHRNSPADAQSLCEEISDLGRRAAAFPRDLSDLSSPGRFWDDIESRMGAVSCLVNNASIFSPDTIEDFADDGGALFAEHLRVNTGAPLQLARLLHARLPAGEQGVVVNLLDQKLWNPNPDFLSYTLSKVALESATGLLARALAPRVRVVGVAPGITLPSGDQTFEAFVQAHQRTPLGRSSTPADIAQAVAFVVQARAITGTTLLVDGGQHLLPTERDIQFLVK